MDLVQTVRKEGSRGGRADFKWEDVKADAQRENYLGHSLMAPVGRWQNGRDLNWYAKGDDPDKQTAAEKLAEEKRRVKEAEEDAMLAAMGLPVPERASKNANLTPLGKLANNADIDRAMADIAAADDDGEERVKEGRGPDRSRRERSRDRDGDRKKRRRSRSRSREHRSRRKERSRSKERRRDKETVRDGHRDHDKRRHRSRSRDRKHRDEDRRPKRHSGEERSRSRDRYRRRRSRSPDERTRRRRD